MGSFEISGGAVARRYNADLPDSRIALTLPAMPVYVISYDLNKPGKDYEPLWAELRRLGCKSILLSQWAGNLTGTAENVRDHFWRYMDSNDRLLIMERDGGNFAAINLMTKLSDIS